MLGSIAGSLLLVIFSVLSNGIINIFFPFIIFGMRYAYNLVTTLFHFIDCLCMIV